MLVAVLLLVAAAEPIDNADAIRDAAANAAKEERWCDARSYYVKLFERKGGEMKWLFNAAELSRVAKDNVGALARYREVKQRAPDFQPERVNQMIAELELALSKGDIGTPCAEPTPVCGNGAIEGAEQCDDADSDDGDGCKATCELAEVIAPPPPPEKKEAPPPPPPPGEPPTEGGGLGTIGIIVGASGAVVGTGLTITALVLDARLQQPAQPNGPSREEKSSLLFAGWPIAITAGVGFAAAAAGVAMVLIE